MKANEFRLGNLVYYHIEDSMDERKEWDEISPIDYDDLRCFVEYEDNSEYKPIPLTEEWLLKFGNARKSTEPNEIIVYERFSFNWKESYKYWYVVTIDSLEYLTKIEFVHEYQNFIFALTGEELKTK